MLTSFANTFAKTNSESLLFLQDIDVQSYDNITQNLDCFIFSSDENKHRHSHFSEAIDFEKTEENEEESHSEKLTRSNFVTTSSFNYSVDSTYFSFTEKPKQYFYGFKETSVKLTIKFQVFRIWYST